VAIPGIPASSTTVNATSPPTDMVAGTEEKTVAESLPADSDSTVVAVVLVVGEVVEVELFGNEGVVGGPAPVVLVVLVELVVVVVVVVVLVVLVVLLLPAVVVVGMVVVVVVVDSAIAAVVVTG